MPASPCGAAQHAARARGARHSRGASCADSARALARSRRARPTWSRTRRVRPTPKANTALSRNAADVDRASVRAHSRPERSRSTRGSSRSDCLRSAAQDTSVELAAGGVAREHDSRCVADRIDHRTVARRPRSIRRSTGQELRCSRWAAAVLRVLRRRFFAPSSPVRAFRAAGFPATHPTSDSAPLLESRASTSIRHRPSELSRRTRSSRPADRQSCVGAVQQPAGGAQTGRRATIRQLLSLSRPVGPCRRHRPPCSSARARRPVRPRAQRERVQPAVETPTAHVPS